ncbi:hypothetical protein [Bacillus mycoides]|nr:hypothetical protein [Bacillus mycoides]
MLNVMNVLSRGLEKQLFQLLVTLMRVLFGMGWFWAGVTKITEKHWFSEPGFFLKHYFIMALAKPNVPEFYHDFIQYIALKNTMFFNYVIPIVQIIVGICMIIGLLIIPSVCICLFMHINFILSGNMNLISLTLYTSAFGILFFLERSYVLSLDRYFRIEKYFKSNKQTMHYYSSKVS